MLDLEALKPVGVVVPESSPIRSPLTLDENARLLLQGCSAAGLGSKGDWARMTTYDLTEGQSAAWRNW
jgi:hypothetical protein